MKKESIDVNMSHTIEVGKNMKTGKIEIKTAMDFIPTTVAERIANEVEDITLKSLIESDAKELTDKLMMQQIDIDSKVTFWRFAAICFALTTVIALLRLGGVI